MYGLSLSHSTRCIRTLVTLSTALVLGVALSGCPNVSLDENGPACSGKDGIPSCGSGLRVNIYQCNVCTAAGKCHGHCLSYSRCCAGDQSDTSPQCFRAKQD